MSGSAAAAATTTQLQPTTTATTSSFGTKFSLEALIRKCQEAEQFIIDSEGNFSPCEQYPNCPSCPDPPNKDYTCTQCGAIQMQLEDVPPHKLKVKVKKVPTGGRRRRRHSSSDVSSSSSSVNVSVDQLQRVVEMIYALTKEFESDDGKNKMNEQDKKTMELIILLPDKEASVQYAKKQWEDAKLVEEQIQGIMRLDDSDLTELEMWWSERGGKELNDTDPTKVLYQGELKDAEKTFEISTSNYEHFQTYTKIRKQIYDKRYKELLEMKATISRHFLVATNVDDDNNKKEEESNTIGHGTSAEEVAATSPVVTVVVNNDAAPPGASTADTTTTNKEEEEEIEIEETSGGSANGGSPMLAVASGQQPDLMKERIQLLLALQQHAATCISPMCATGDCTEMKGLWKHAAQCQIKPSGGCNVCKFVWALLQTHARNCNASSCPVPNCMSIRERIRQLEDQQQGDDDESTLEELSDFCSFLFLFFAAGGGGVGVSEATSAEEEVAPTSPVVTTAVVDASDDDDDAAPGGGGDTNLSDSSAVNDPETAAELVTGVTDPAAVLEATRTVDSHHFEQDQPSLVSNDDSELDRNGIAGSHHLGQDQPPLVSDDELDRSGIVDSHHFEQDQPSLVSNDDSELDRNGIAGSHHLVHQPSLVSDDELDRSGIVDSHHLKQDQPSLVSDYGPEFEDRSGIAEYAHQEDQPSLVSDDGDDGGGQQSEGSSAMVARSLGADSDLWQ